MKPRTSPETPRRASWVPMSALALTLAAPAASRAQGVDASTETGWFVRLGPRVLFNIKASVERLPQSVQTGVYDNGFVLPDSTGTASGRTWNWGYQEAGQLVNDQLRLQRLTGAPMAGLFTDETSDPSLGGEIVGGVELGRFSVGERRARYGVEVGLGYNTFSVKNSSSAASVATLVTDGYNLGGTTPPVPPYSGSFNGPGPRIDLYPSFGTAVTSPAQATSSGELDTSLYTLKLGLWVDYPLAHRLYLGGSLGYISLYVDADYSFTDATSYDSPAIPDVPSTQRSVGGTEWQPGFYSQFRLRYDFTRTVGVYVGGEFSFIKDFEVKDQGRAIKFDLSATLAATAGLNVRF